MAAQQQQQPLFGTVLVARSPQKTPSGLELQMRHYSTRLRIVEKLSGGAHLLLPGSERTIAVRAYYEMTLPNKTPSSETLRQRLASWHDPTAARQDNWDDLVSFRKAFKYPIVFFILPPGPLQVHQLCDGDSCLQRAQRIMNDSPAAAATTTTANHNTSASSPRVFVVPDVASAVQILSSLLDALQPHKQDMKRKYFAQVASRLFLPSSTDPMSISSHVADVLRDWATRMNLPADEVDVLMSLLKTLSTISTADAAVLDTVPVEDATKALLQNFFGGISMPDNNTAPPPPVAAENFGAMLAMDEPPFDPGPSLQEFMRPMMSQPQQYGAPMASYPANMMQQQQQPPPSMYYPPNPPYGAMAPQVQHNFYPQDALVRPPPPAYPPRAQDPWGSGYGVMPTSNQILAQSSYTPRYPSERSPASSFGGMHPYSQHQAVAYPQQAAPQRQQQPMMPPPPPRPSFGGGGGAMPPPRPMGNPIRPLSPPSFQDNRQEPGGPSSYEQYLR